MRKAMTAANFNLSNKLHFTFNFQKTPPPQIEH